MPQRPFATIVVGPCTLRREGLARILGAADFHIAASASSIDDQVLTTLPRRRPSILLIIDVGDDLSAAVRQVELFKKRYPAGRVAVLADHDQPSDIVQAFRAGANAYFIKVAPCDAFIKSLELVMLGETILPAAILSTIVDRADEDKTDHESAIDVRDVSSTAGDHLEAQSGDTPRLSTRERCILNCLIEGDSNKVIARKIDIAEATVKVHVKAILRKIRVHTRTQAAIWAMNKGLSISPVGNGAAVPANALVQPPPATSHLAPAAQAMRRNGSALPPPADTQEVQERLLRIGMNRRSC
jgi:two-component system nitrate/nitrite response regulator NarL